MDELLFIGELSADYNFGTESEAPNNQSIYQPIIDQIGQMIESTCFKKNAKVRRVKKWEELYVLIEEITTEATLTQKEAPGDSFIKSKGSNQLESLTLSQIQQFPCYDDGYVVPHTIVTHKCNLEMRCPTCEGSGVCPDCKGKHYVVCDVCDGEKLCPSCSGTGKYPCYSCNQTGECRYCDGEGEVECDNCDGDGWVWVDVECHACCGTGDYHLRNGGYVTCKACRGTGVHHRKKEDCDECFGDGTITCDKCDGEGTCSKCEGEGYVTCRACGGYGNCGKCNGKGKVKCKMCHATGVCPTCHSTGRVTCSVCNGTGYYQTFDTIELSNSSRQLILRNKKSAVVSVDKGVKRIHYTGEPYVSEFSKISINDNRIMEILNSHKANEHIDKMNEYRRSFVDSTGKSMVPKEKCVKSKVLVEGLPVLNLSIKFSWEVFNFYIVGETGCVYCDKKPSMLHRICAGIF